MFGECWVFDQSIESLISFKAIEFKNLLLLCNSMLAFCLVKMWITFKNTVNLDTKINSNLATKYEMFLKFAALYLATLAYCINA